MTGRSWPPMQPGTRRRRSAARSACPVPRSPGSCAAGTAPSGPVPEPGQVRPCSGCWARGTSPSAEEDDEPSPQAEPPARALGESLAALAVQVAALRGQVAQINERLDRAGLHGDLDLAARFEELAQTVADALDAVAPRGPAAPSWIGLDRQAFARSSPSCGGGPMPCCASTTRAMSCGIAGRPHPRRLGTVHPGRRMAPCLWRPAPRPGPRPGVLRSLAPRHHAPHRPHYPRMRPGLRHAPPRLVTGPVSRLLARSWMSLHPQQAPGRPDATRPSSPGPRTPATSGRRRPGAGRPGPCVSRISTAPGVLADLGAVATAVPAVAALPPGVAHGLCRSFAIFWIRSRDAPFGRPRPAAPRSPCVAGDHLLVLGNLPVGQVIQEHRHGPVAILSDHQPALQPDMSRRARTGSLAP